ncbi:unnamed protein product, partial [Iphiclides podalirius]
MGRGFDCTAVVHSAVPVHPRAFPPFPNASRLAIRLPGHWGTAHAPGLCPIGIARRGDVHLITRALESFLFRIAGRSPLGRRPARCTAIETLRHDPLSNRSVTTISALRAQTASEIEEDRSVSPSGAPTILVCSDES